MPFIVRQTSLVKKVFLITLSVAFACLLPASVSADFINIGGPSDCNDNAMIRCGVHSTNDLISNYNGDPYVRSVYRHFGISRSEIGNLNNTNVAGRVTRTGKVYINSQAGAVATGAVTAGRQNMPGSTKVNTAFGPFYMRPTSVSFQESSLPAFVSMNNGQFQFAIIASCGNAVMATPKPAPPQPAAPAPTQPMPTPTPTQSQSQVQSQSQSVVVETPPVVTTAAAPAPAPAPAPVVVTPTKTLVNTGSIVAVPVLAFLATVGLGYAFFRWYMISRLFL